MCSADLQYVALGLCDGSIILVNNILDRFPKSQVVLEPSGYPITGNTSSFIIFIKSLICHSLGLGFRSGTAVVLFVSTSEKGASDHCEQQDTSTACSG